MGGFILFCLLIKVCVDIALLPFKLLIGLFRRH